MMSRHWLTPAHQLWARATHVSWCNQFDNSLPLTKGVIIKRRKGPLSRWIGGVLWGMWEMCISHHYHRPRADCPFHPTQPVQVASKQSIKIISISAVLLQYLLWNVVTILNNSYRLLQPALICLFEWQWSQARVSPGVNVCLCLGVSQQINLNHFSAHPVITVTLCYTVTWHPVLDMSLGFSWDDWSCLRLGYVGRLVTLGSGRIIQKISRNN